MLISRVVHMSVSKPHTVPEGTGHRPQSDALRPGLGTESQPEARDWTGTEKTQSRAGAQNTLKTPLLGDFNRDSTHLGKFSSPDGPTFFGFMKKFSKVPQLE